MSGQIPKTRFNKLTLKKNKATLDNVVVQQQSSSFERGIVLEDSFDQLKAQAASCVKSPIIIDDSSEISEMSINDAFPKVATEKFPSNSENVNLPVIIADSSEISDTSINDQHPKVTTEKFPSNSGNASFNCTQSDTCMTKPSRPRIGGWSPAQAILCSTPLHKTIPTTPKDKHNESIKQCSIKKIQQHQKKLLDDLYGEVWRSIPKLFKPATSSKTNNFDDIAKRLFYNDQEDKKDNVREAIALNKHLYLTGSDAKRKVKTYPDDTEKKCKKRLYTVEPNTPDHTKKTANVDFDCPSYTRKSVKKKTVRVKKNVETVSKKLEGKSVTELVELMNDKRNSKCDELDINTLVRQVRNITVSPVNTRLSFVGSLADNIPSYRCHTEAIKYIDNFKTLKEKLTRRLFEEFNEKVFWSKLDNDMLVTWDTKLRSTAGTTTNRHVKNSKGESLRSSSIKLSVKVLDKPGRLRNTLIHEMCHAATWVIDHIWKAGHGPVWKKWAQRALQVYPELGEIPRCHKMVIHFKYTYKCTKCGYSISRHSKSIDITKKCCGRCRGTFEVILNKKNKNGVVVSTPARKAEVNGFALYVKENYGSLKSGNNHAQVMKLLGEQFALNRNK